MRRAARGRSAGALLAGMLAGACIAAEPAGDAIATPVRIAAAPDDDFADLAPFGSAVGRARLVALDEQTHGGREEFLLKTRLLRYLHERLGFDVLVLESGFFDVGRIQQARASGAKVDDLAPDNVFFMYSKSAQGRALLQYVDATRATAHPLVLAGMDSQHSGALSGQALVPELAKFLQARGSSLAKGPRWRGFASTVHDMLKLHAVDSPGDERDFQAVSKAALRELRDVKAPNAGWWRRSSPTCKRRTSNCASRSPAHATGPWATTWCGSPSSSRPASASCCGATRST